MQNFAAYVAAAGQLVVIPMIETAAGLANASAIAKVKGLDMIFVGSGDLALSLQTSGGDPKKHVAACASIKRACDAAGLPCGMFTGTHQAAMDHQALGYGMVVLGNDIDVVARGFSSATDDLRKAMADAASAAGSAANAKTGKGSRAGKR